MMKRHIYIICSVLLMLMAVSCQEYGNKHYYHELEKIDHRHNRDLARREIMALQDEIASYPEYIKMYHQLLIAELNEEVLPYRNQEMVRNLVSYYEETNDREKLIRSYIIAGKVFTHCNGGPQALAYYHKAEDLMDNESYPELLNQLYQQMTYLFLHHNMLEQARNYADLSLNYCRHKKDTVGMIQALRYLGETSKKEGISGNGLANLDAAYQLAKQAKRYHEQKELLIDLASCNYDLGRYNTALAFLRPLKNKLPKDEAHRVNALLAKIYYKIGETDSAVFFARQALVNGNSISQRDAHQVLAHTAIKQGNHAAAEEHLSKYEELNDAINRYENSEAVAQMDAFYHNQKQAEENARLRFDNSHKQNVIVIFIACTAVLIILFATYIQRHRRKQELMALRIQQLEELRQAYENTDKDELIQNEQSIRDTDIYHRLTVMENSEHLTDEDWQALTEAVGKAYPKFSSRLFSLCNVSTHEYHVCLLLKAGIEPARIGVLTLRSKAAISTVRSRLYEKAFGKKGSAKDWDEVILTL